VSPQAIAAVLFLSLLLLVVCGGSELRDVESGDVGAGAGNTSNGAEPGEGSIVDRSLRVATSNVLIELVLVAGVSFLMGRSAAQAGRQAHEGPEVAVIGRTILDRSVRDLTVIRRYRRAGVSGALRNIAAREMGWIRK
jgi:hypothetical protein